MPRTRADVLRIVKQEKVRIIRLWFTDILGRLKGFALPISELPHALDEGMGFDGSSIEGFVRIYESDLIAMPDISTFRLLPWSIDDQKTAGMFCDVLTPNGKPFPGDPRFILKRNLEKARKLGYTFNIGPELEFFYFRSSEKPEFLDHGGYFDLTPLTIGTRLRKKTITALESLAIQVEYSHHEVAPSQHEIDLRYQEALAMADMAMLYRLVVKEVAREEGVYASFMPKPVFGVNGSGMHCHQSLFKGGRNAFFDPRDPYHLSGVAKQYIAGLLKYVREFTAVTNQWVNSYKRLVVGYEAPVYISWARRNRSALVRIPMYKPGKEKATRVELRNPDPATNPYLCFAVMLAAGLRGVEEKLPLHDPVEEDIFEMSEDKRRRLGIKTLPASLYEAILLAERSELVRETLGDDLFFKFIANKKTEWDEYRMQVTDVELAKYLPFL
jgi:glutamine synthetase